MCLLIIDPSMFFLISYMGYLSKFPRILGEICMSTILFLRSYLPGQLASRFLKGELAKSINFLQGD